MEHKTVGNQRFAAGDVTGAVAAYTEGIFEVRARGDDLDDADRNTLVDLYCNKSRALLKLKPGDMENALQAAAFATQAIDIKPFWAKAFLCRAAARLDFGDYRNALVDCDKASQLDPQVGAAAEELADCARSRVTAGQESGFAPSQWAVAQRDACKKHHTCYTVLVPTGHGAGDSQTLPEGLVDMDPSSAATVSIVQRVPVSPGTPDAVQKALRKAFKEAVNTGSPTAVQQLYVTLVTHAHTIGIRPEHAAAQVGAEFPHVNRPLPSSSPLQHTVLSSAATEVSRVSIYQMQRAAKKDGRIIYPGRSRWLDWPQAFHAFVKATFPRSLDYNTLVETASKLNGQRQLDGNTRRLEKIYEGRLDEPMTVAQHLELHQRCGFRIATELARGAEVPQSMLTEFEARRADWVRLPPLQFSNAAAGTGLGAASNDPPLPEAALNELPPPRCCRCFMSLAAVADPTECRCGETYCSDQCHMLDWLSGHRQVCDSVTAARKGALQFNELYWDLVANGSLPDPSFVDFVGIWRRRWNKPILGTSQVLDGPTEPHTGFLPEDKAAYDAAVADVNALADSLAGDTDAFTRAELQFLHTHERKYLAERVARAQTHDACAVLAEVLTQRSRVLSPQPLDSVARLRFKLALCSVYDAMGAVMLPVLRSDKQLSPDKLANAFKPVIRDAEKRDGVTSQTATALGTYKYHQVRGAVGSGSRHTLAPMSRESCSLFYDGLSTERMAK